MRIEKINKENNDEHKEQKSRQGSFKKKKHLSIHASGNSAALKQEINKIDTIIEVE